MRTNFHVKCEMGAKVNGRKVKKIYNFTGNA